MTEFDAARFTIVVRKEATDDGEMFVARVTELPDVAIYGESFEYAYEGAIETIEAAKEVFDENKEEFPSPEIGSDSQYSGRLPIRTSRTLHRSLVLSARREGVSLNAYVNLLLASKDAIDSLCQKVESAIGRSSEAEVVGSDHIESATAGGSNAVH